MACQSKDRCLLTNQVCRFCLDASVVKGAHRVVGGMVEVAVAVVDPAGVFEVGIVGVGVVIIGVVALSVGVELAVSTCVDVLLPTRQQEGQVYKLASHCHHTKVMSHCTVQMPTSSADEHGHAHGTDA